MPFKIVQIIENGKQNFTICPSEWEVEDILRWPKRNAAKLSKIEFSKPGSDWTQINCILERRDIATYNDAKEILDSMLNNTGIYEEDEDNKDFIMKDLLTCGRGLTQQVDEAVVVLTPQNANSNNDSDDEESDSNINSDKTDNMTKFEKILYNQKILFDNQNVILENQKTIMSVLTKVSKKLDVMTSNETYHDAQCETDIDVKFKKKTKFCLKPIQTLNEFKHLEKELSDEYKKETYKQKYSIFCSRGKGLNCAYQLIDIFFTREFLTQCSWSGCSRGSGMKISLKTFQEFLNFFFELIHDCDPTYTIQDNNSFFKTILKNSAKRTLAKFQRISTARKRQKQSDCVLDNSEKIKEPVDTHTTTQTTTHTAMDTEETNEHDSTDAVADTDALKQNDVKTCNDNTNSKIVKITTSDNKDSKNATLTFNVILKVD